jgi:hypothetical protein
VLYIVLNVHAPCENKSNDVQDSFYEELGCGRKQAKLQWLQVPNEVNEDNISNARWEASRHFRNKKR